MSSSRNTRRALAALGALVVVAAISVPTALAAMGPDADTILDGPDITPTASPATEPQGATLPIRAAAPQDLAPPAAIDPGASIVEAIIQRLSLPTGPVLLESPPAAVEAAPVVAPAAAAVGPAAPAPVADEPAAAEAAPPRPERNRNPAPDRNPAPNRNPARNDADDLIEVEVYGAAIPEPPEVASSTTTETVLVAPDPSDPWYAVRECESRGNYAANTGNGFYGAYQFTISTWNWVAGTIDRRDLIGVRPDRASPADQDRMANALAFEVRGGGLGHWPVCGRLYGS